MIKKIIITISLLAWLLPQITLAHHTEHSETLSLDELRLQVLANSPEVRRIDTALANASAKAITLRTLENPTLAAAAGIPVSYPDSRPDTEVEVSISQPLRMSDFGLRDSVSDLLDSLANTNKKLAIQKLLQKISLDYVRLWALQVEETHIQDRQKRAARIAKLLLAATDEGRASVSEARTAKANLAQAKADLIGLAHAQKKLIARLSKHSGADLSKVRFTKPLPSKIDSFEQFYNRVKESNENIVARMRIRSELAEEQVKLAKREAYPTLTPQLSYMRNDDGADFVGIGVSFPLPFFNRNKGEISKHQVERASTKQELNYFLSPLFKQELQLLYESLEAKNQQAAIYDSEVIPELQKAMEFAEEAFQGGQGSLSDLWITQNSLHDALDTATQIWIEAYGSAIELSLLSGNMKI